MSCLLCRYSNSGPKSLYGTVTAAEGSPACTAPPSLQHATCCLQCPKGMPGLYAVEPASAGIDALPGLIPHKDLSASPARRGPPDAAASLTATEPNALADILTALSAREQSAAGGSGGQAPPASSQQAAEAWVPPPIAAAPDSSGAAGQPATVLEGPAAAAVEPAEATQASAAAGGFADAPEQAAAAREPAVALEEAPAAALEQAADAVGVSQEAPLLLADTLACLVRSCNGAATKQAGPADGAASGGKQVPPAEEQDGTGDASCSARGQQSSVLPCQAAAEEPPLQPSQLDGNTEQGSLAVEAPAPSHCEDIPAEEAAGPEATASTAACREEAEQAPVLQKDQHSLPWQDDRPTTCPQLHTAARSAATAPKGGSVADPQACHEAGTGGSEPGSTPAAESDTGPGPAAGREGQSCLQLDSVSSHLAPLAPSESSDVELSDVDLSDVELEPVPGLTAAASAPAAGAAVYVKGRQSLSDVVLSQGGGTRQGPAPAAAAATAVASRRQGVPDQELSGMELEAALAMAEPGTAVLRLHCVESPFPMLL